MIAGAIFGEHTVRRLFTPTDRLNDGRQSRLDHRVDDDRAQNQRELVTTVIGICTLIFGAAGVFGELQDALNTVWDVKPKPHAGIWLYLRNRFLSLSMVLGLGFLLLISMVLTTAAEAAFKNRRADFLRCRLSSSPSSVQL